MIENALVAGFTVRRHGRAAQLGPLPTPAVAMLTRSMRADLGVMISASHNPYRRQRHQAVRPRRLQALRRGRARDRGADRRRPRTRLASPPTLGRAKRIDDVQARYIEFAKRTLPRRPALDGLRVVIDCANGAAYKVAPEALWELGAEVFPHRRRARRLQHQQDCGSTAPEALVAQGARDARRYRHRARWRRRPRGDRRREGPRRRWRPDPGGDRRKLGRGAAVCEARGVVATVMSNLGLERFLDALGLDLARTPVGDRYVLEAMREERLSMSAANSPATSSCPISRPRATASSRRCRCSRWSRRRAGRYRKFAIASSRCRSAEERALQ